MGGPDIPNFSAIEKAHQQILPYIHQTPVLTSRQIDERVKASVFFKCENFQRVGAFKFRGAMNALRQLGNKEAKAGVATHSSGNHAQAVALAAGKHNIPAYIVMPENSPTVKVNAVKGYGGHIIFCEPTWKARERALKQVVDRTGAYFIHSYNDPRIIVGQGTATLEFLKEYPKIDILMTPVGGGGLLSGTSIAAKNIKPDIITIGVEPEQADDAFKSFQAGKIIPSEDPDTVADGLRTSLGLLTFKTIQTYTDDIVTVSENAIIEAMRFIWERMKIIVEPSGAVPLAALLEDKVPAEGKNVGIILSGGNTDLEKLPWNQKKSV